MKSLRSRLAVSAMIGFCLTTAAWAQGNPPEKAEKQTAPAPPPPNPCPQLVLNAPAGRILKDGETVSISAGLAGGDASAIPNFVWTTSAGVIASGQGTRNVSIDSTGAGNDRQISVDLWVSGYAPECALQANAKINVVPPPHKAVEFGEMEAERESELLKGFLENLSGSSDNVYVFGYAGRTTVRGYTSANLKRIKATLLTHGMNSQRLGLIDGGYRETPAFEIWLVPVGADVPRSTPTIAAKDIVFPKPAGAPGKKP